MRPEFKLIFFAVAAYLVSGCGNYGTGELVGVSQYPGGYQVLQPFGMNYIHTGSYTMGNNDGDIQYTHAARAKTVTIASFFIDDTEISNSEYRQFISSVRDSIQRYALAESGVGIEEYFLEDDETGEPILLYDAPIDTYNEEVTETLEEFYIEENERFYGQKVFDVRRLIFKYYWINYHDASNKNTRDVKMEAINKIGGSRPVMVHNNREGYLIEENVAIYPDTLVWVADFVGANNDHMSENYFWHPAYDQYPIVGITWSQARAFNVWRTQLMNVWKSKNGDLAMPSFRLPTEAEWEFAARGGLDMSPYPWGGPYLRNRLGCPLANYKPLRGDYVDDGAMYTVEVTKYEPNDYGLFNMAGNVAEWTSTAYDESVFEFQAELNPEYYYEAKASDPPALKRKVIRGGSWKDIPYYLQCGTRTYEYQDTAKSYVGFRSVMSYLGRGIDPEDQQ